MPKIPKVSLGFGLKKQEKQAEAAPAQPIAQEEQNRPFTDDQLRDAWVGLAATYNEELRLKQLIETYMPKRINETTAEIQMPNPWQLQEMKKALPILIQKLHTTLRNSALQINLVQAEFSQEQMAFTAEEKFAIMADQNPVLNELKEKLDLQID